MGGDIVTRKKLEKITATIRDLGKYPILEKTGENKGDNVEIFTPKWMFALMPYKQAVVDNGTIFEPSSGDGAFTVYILHARLMHIYAELIGRPVTDWIKSVREQQVKQNGKKSTQMQGKHSIFIRWNPAIQIIGKVQERKEVSLTDIISAVSPYGIATTAEMSDHTAQGELRQVGRLFE
jgi:hypothetical protein